jgi:hypothetical protein
MTRVILEKLQALEADAKRAREEVHRLAQAAACGSIDATIAQIEKVALEIRERIAGRKYTLEADDGPDVAI